MQSTAGAVQHGPAGAPVGPAATGRPRSDRVTERVRLAARAAFAERGMAAVTMAQIASTAGVGLDSIYRRWASKPALLVDVVAELVADEVAVPDTGSLARDLQELVADLIRAVNGDLGRLLATAVAEAAHDPALARQLADAQARRRQVTAVVVERALGRGELRPDVDPQLLLDALAGLVWQRSWLSADVLSPAHARGLVRGILVGFAADHP